MNSTTTMKWTSSLSVAARPEEALAEVLAELKSKLAGMRPDIAFLFVSPKHRAAYTQIAATVLKQLSPRHVLGCSGGGIIGGGREAEQSPALSVSAVSMPNVEFHPIRIEDANLPDLDSGPKAWQQLIGLKTDAATGNEQDTPQFILLADPFSIRVEDMLAGFDFAYPQSVKVGGLASGARSAGQNALYLDDHTYNDGAVGLALSGDVRIDPLVAQGCRPLGKLMSVTRCQRNLLIELDKRRALDVMGELIGQADEHERDLIRHTSLFLGLVMDPFKKGTPGPGDFLIRNLLGMDEKRGVLAVGGILREGQNVQFHLFDASAASDDLSAVLRRYSTERLNASKGEALPSPPRGALLFSCLGRGERLYGHPNHDSDAFRAQLGDVPLAGFFCNGEIGPVSGTTYVHGYTSCFGIFRTK